MMISIHAPRGGSDKTVRPNRFQGRHFNPRSPWGERLGRISPVHMLGLFQSTLPVGGATQLRPDHHIRQDISIHAPRGGSDKYEGQPHQLYRDFNPRSPWGERLNPILRSTAISNFNPRSPWGERPALTRSDSYMYVISIHAPRGGSDLHVFQVTSPIRIFQSTLPVGGATGSDCRVLWFWSYFNPRSPWGERPHTNTRAARRQRISIHAPRGGSD